MGQQVGASPPLSTRLPRWLDEQIRQEFGRLGVSPSTGLRQILEEWWVARRFPALEHRDPEFTRFAAIRRGPGVVEWIDDGRPPLDPAAEEQLLDYVALFRYRLECAVAARRATRSPSAEADQLHQP